MERLRTIEYEPIRRAHTHYYAALAEQADASLRGDRQQWWLRRLDAEAANVRSALDGAVADGDARLARRLTHAMVWYWFLRGRLTEAKRSLSLALAIDAAAAGEDPARACTAAWLSGMSMLSGDRSGRTWDSQAVPKMHADIDDRHQRATAGWFLALALTRFGDMAIGEALGNQVLTEFRALDDSWGIAAALVTRSTQSYVCGALDSSRRDATESLTLFRDLGDQWGQSQAMAMLGRLAEVAGEYAEAARWHRDGLRIAEALGLWTDASTRWSELGRAALLTGDHAQAQQYHERGRQLAVEQGDKPAQEFAEVGLALGARRQGQLDVAEEYLHTWLAWNQRFDAENGTALILAELGFVAELRGDAETALALHRAGLDAARRTGDPRAVALALEGLAGARALAGRHEHAARLLGAATKSRASVGAPLPQAERGDVDRVSAAARAALGDADFATALAQGAEQDGDE